MERILQIPRMPKYYANWLKVTKCQMIISVVYQSIRIPEGISAGISCSYSGMQQGTWSSNSYLSSWASWSICVATTDQASESKYCGFVETYCSAVAAAVARFPCFVWKQVFFPLLLCMWLLIVLHLEGYEYESTHMPSHKQALLYFMYTYYIVINVRTHLNTRDILLLLVGLWHDNFWGVA